METLKYKVIRDDNQYDKYCRQLEKLLNLKAKSNLVEDEIELLTVLIEKWDAEHNTYDEIDPIELLHILMEEHKMKPIKLAETLGVTRGLVSDILHYKKGLSKEIIRNLAAYFKLSQEAFNRPYKLKVPENKHFKNASVMNTQKAKKVAIVNK